MIDIALLALGIGAVVAFYSANKERVDNKKDQLKKMFKED